MSSSTAPTLEKFAPLPPPVVNAVNGIVIVCVAAPPVLGIEAVASDQFAALE